jgi:hypothetical protein
MQGPIEVRRRISWQPRCAEVDLGSRGSPDLHRFRWVVRQHPGEEPQWTLEWDGLQVDLFPNEPVLRQYLIRFAYGIENKYLIPSEILADAGLHYTTGDWVDSWVCTDENCEIALVPENVSLAAPPNRNIRLPRLPEERPQIRAQFLRLQRGANGEKPRLKLIQVEGTPAEPRERTRFRKIEPSWRDPSSFSGAVSFLGIPLWGRSSDRLLDEECVFKFGGAAACECPEEAPADPT